MHMESFDEAIRADEMDEGFFSAALRRSREFAFGKHSTAPSPSPSPSQNNTPLSTQSSAESIESLKEWCLQSQQQQQHQGSIRTGDDRCWVEAARAFEYPIPPSPRVSRRRAEDGTDVYCGIPWDCPRSLAGVQQRTERFFNHLERVSADSGLAHSNALYMSTTPRKVNPSSGEDTMISVWDPSPQNVAANVLPLSGHTTNIIGTATRKPSKAAGRTKKKKNNKNNSNNNSEVDHYKRYNNVFKVELPTPEELNDSGRSFTGCL